VENPDLGIEHSLLVGENVQVRDAGKGVVIDLGTDLQFEVTCGDRLAER
jgi:hypothetical protein